MLCEIFDTLGAATDTNPYGCCSWALAGGVLKYSAILFCFMFHLIEVSGQSLFVPLLLTAIDEHPSRHGDPDRERLCAHRFTCGLVHR